MSLSVRAVAAGVLIVIASPAQAGNITDVFTSEPRIDLALELEYRSWYLAPDFGLSGHLPADRIGRERFEDARRRVARAYLDVLGDGIADALVDQIPFAQALEQRYRKYSAVKLLGEEPPNALVPAPRSWLPPEPAPRPFSLRLRLNALGEGFDLAPGIELIQGPLEWRVAYRPFSDRLETTARRPLTDRFALEFTGEQSLSRGETALRVGFSWQF